MFIYKGSKMTQMQLLRVLDEWDKKGKWVFIMRDLYLLFSKESPQIVKDSLVRHTKSGLIERICKGVYANPRALSKERVYDILGYVSNFIREKAFSYLSLETVLSENNVISQIPFRYTFVSRLASAEFHTPYGTIEYTQTKRNPKGFFKNCYYDRQREIWVAKTKQAVADAYAFNRAVDLIVEKNGTRYENI